MKKVTIFPAIIYMLFLLWELDAQSEYPEAMVGISHAYYTSFDSDNPFATKKCWIIYVAKSLILFYHW